MCAASYLTQWEIFCTLNGGAALEVALSAEQTALVQAALVRLALGVLLHQMIALCKLS